MPPSAQRRQYEGPDVRTGEAAGRPEQETQSVAGLFHRQDGVDEATRRREYHRALEIMEGLVQKNPAAKQFQEFTKKLKDIDDIATPNKP